MAPGDAVLVSQRTCRAAHPASRRSPRPLGTDTDCVLRAASPRERARGRNSRISRRENYRTPRYAGDVRKSLFFSRRRGDVIIRPRNDLGNEIKRLTVICRNGTPTPCAASVRTGRVLVWRASISTRLVTERKRSQNEQKTNVSAAVFSVVG